jgi:hypothetical protein
MMNRPGSRQALCCLLVPAACGCTAHHFGNMVDGKLDRSDLTWESIAPLATSPSVSAFPSPAFEYLVLEEYRAVDGCAGVSGLDSSFQTLRPDSPARLPLDLQREIPSYGTVPARSLLGGLVAAATPAGVQRAYTVLEAPAANAANGPALPGSVYVYYKDEDQQGYLKYDFQPDPEDPAREQVRLLDAQKRTADGHTYISNRQCSFQYRPDLAWFIPAGYAVLDYGIAGEAESHLEQQARATSAEDRTHAGELMRQALQLDQAGDLDGAASQLYQALDLDPGNAAMQFQLGQALEKLHLGYAAWHYRQAIRWQPGSDAAAQAKARLDELNGISTTGP